MESFEQSLHAAGILADDLRRRMYLFIRTRRGPVGRDEAAEAVGISRKLAAFHLDKLVEKGLLTAHYVRLSGRVGPGAGRPAKVYEPSETEVSVSIPPRSYDFAGRLLVKALERAECSPGAGFPVSPGESVRRTAYEEGFELGREVRRDQGLRSPGSRRTVQVAQQVLYERGYEPYRDEEGALRLQNCPFHALARQSRELVCGMNRAFITGLLEGIGESLGGRRTRPSPRGVLRSSGRTRRQKGPKNMSSDPSRTILLTGGTGALGTAVAKRLLDDGHRVVATFVVKEEAETLVGSIGRTERLVVAETDVTDPDSVARTVEDTQADIGPIEAMVHLVGAWKGGAPVHDMQLDLWDRMLDLNLRSAMLCSRAVLPSMRQAGWGRIVLVSSRTAREGRAGQGAYAIAKAGVAVLAETIAEENRGLNVTANVVAPSTLDTPANRSAMPQADFSAWVPLEDVATSIAFLTSPQAGQLRGAWLPLYGSA